MPADHVTDPATARARAYFEDFAHDYDDAARDSGWLPNGRLAEALADAGFAPGPGADQDVGPDGDPACGPSAGPSVEPTVRALDLACGTGTTLAVLEGALPRATLVGVDVAETMVRIAAERVPRARCLRADLRDYVERSDERFDVVTAIGGFEFTPDLPGILLGVRRLVQPGGHFFFTYEPVLEGWDPQSARVETNLGSNGFELTTFRWDPGEVAAALDGWVTVSDTLIAAYRRDGVPTIYGWLHVRTP